VFDLGDGAALTLLEEADAPELYDLTDRNRERLRAWLPWADETRSPADTLRFIRMMREQERERGFCLKVEGRIAGCVGLHGIDRCHLTATIGYWIGGELEGRGLVTKAVRTVVEHAFRDLGLHRLEIRCAVGNARSRAIPQRLGFRQEGILRGAERAAGRHLDVAVYSRLATDPRPPEPPRFG
jgi:ribosomal-protein-serine acetyltransferase